MTVDSDRSVPGLGVAQRGAVLTLRLDRPEQRNAIDDVMMAGLVEAIDLAGRDESVRAIYLTGEGEHFCGGADIIARNADAGSRPRAGSIQRRLPSLAHRLIPLICEVQVPVVCAVKGWAVGIGLQLAAAADFTITAADATFWAPFSERGFTPDSGATWLLPRLVGLARARELDLPVQPGDIQIARSEGKLQLETKYAVQMDFPLYQVDLHFHANGASR